MEVIVRAATIEDAVPPPGFLRAAGGTQVGETPIEIASRSFVEVAYGWTAGLERTRNDGV